MSSDLFSFEDSFFTDPFSPFKDTSTAIPNNCNKLTHENSFDPIAPTFLSSAPTYQLYPATQLPNASNSVNGFENFSPLEVKTEDCQLPFYFSYGYTLFAEPQSYNSSQKTVKMMQKSYSHTDSQNFYTQVLISPENSFLSAQMRRVCTTGDLQNTKTSHRLSTSPLATESSLMEDANSKVGPYSREERKERIHRYRAKRNHRNFSKTIKYACRKALADNRPRIRGRFARNDEMEEIPKAATFNVFEDEDELWMEGFHEDEDGGRGPLFSCQGLTHFHHYGY